VIRREFAERKSERESQKDREHTMLWLIFKRETGREGERGRQRQTEEV
jgi:hypothetical protein